MKIDFKTKKRNLNQFLLLLESRIKKMFNDESSGHDIWHLERVTKLAQRIQQIEGGDKMVITLAAFLHDIHRVISNKNHKYCAPRDSLPVIIKLLKNLSLPEEKIDKILYAVEYHEVYSFGKGANPVTNLETLIIQDADNLDAIGAIGIARAFAYGGANGVPIYIPEVPVKVKDFKESSRDDSEIHHFYNKLLRLRDNMNTKTAKKLASSRHKFMEKYLEQFFAEWDGKK